MLLLQGSSNGRNGRSPRHQSVRCSSQCSFGTGDGNIVATAPPGLPPPPSPSESAELRNDDVWNASTELSDRNVPSEADFSAPPANLFAPRFIYARFKVQSFHSKDEINKDEIDRLIIRACAPSPSYVPEDYFRRRADWQ